jgi:hypothetical protein
MDFGEVLSKAWKIVWKHKVLWIFGILAGCGSGFSSNGSNSFRNTYQGNDFPQVQRFIENIPVWVWILAAVAVVVLVIAAIFLGTIGRIGLIKGAMQAPASRSARCSMKACITSGESSGLVSFRAWP